MKKVNLLTKAQISTFIILGLLTILIFGFIYYAMKSTTEAVVEESTLKVIQEALRTESISSYVTLCLDDSLEQALELIGKQGGYIYKDQPDSIIPFEKSSITYNTDKVAYLIEPIPAKPPWYPCFTQENAPIYCAFQNNIELFPDVYKYTFGTSTLPFLYKSQGLYSIQEQLESYIANQTKTCADFKNLVKIEGYEFYNITEGNISAEISFHENDVSVILKYPISVKIPDQPPITDLLEFKSTAKIRFRKIYESVKDIIQKDNNFLDYDIIADTQSGIFNQQDLKFKEIMLEATIEKQSINTFDDIIIIKDSFSKNGDNYIFQFARKNRNPVLDYINITIKDEDQPFEFSYKAKDPDEDLVSFSASGELVSKLQKSENKYTYTPSEENQLTVNYYPLNLSVSDAQLSDYQTVEILICDRLTNQGALQKCDKRCGAMPECDMKDPNSNINTCDKYGETYFQDKCSSTCQFSDNTLTCKAESENSRGCTANENCDGHIPYMVLSSGWCYGNGGCDSFCDKELMDLNNDFNTQTANPSHICGCDRQGARCFNPPYYTQDEGFCNQTSTNTYICVEYQ